MNPPAYSAALLPLLDFVLHASLLGGAGVLLVMLTRWCLGRHLTPTMRAWLWAPVLLLCISPRLPDLGWRPAPGLTLALASTRETPEKMVQTVVVRGVPEPVYRAGASAAESRPPEGNPDGVSMHGWLALVWSVGTGTIVLFGLVAYVRLWKRIYKLRVADHPRCAAELERCARMAGLSRVPRLLTTHALDNPAAVGIWRPAVLMPAGLAEELDAAALRHVLLHEVGHIRRRDLWLNWISALVVAMHWFNPLAWLAARKLREDRETGCDAMVLEILQEGPKAYGETLLALGTRATAHPSPRLVAGILGGADLLRQRVRDLTRIGKRKRAAAWGAMLGTLSGAAALAVAAAEPPTPAPTKPSAPTPAPSQVEDSSSDERMYTRTFKVAPDFLQRLAEETEPAQPGKQKTAVEVLRKAGIAFPVNASAVFIPSSSQLIVRNTTANLELIRVLIEAKAKEFTKQVYISTLMVVFKKGSKPPFMGNGETAQADAGKKPEGSEGSPVVSHPPIGQSGRQGILALTGVFTDPQYQVVIRALAGKMNGPPGAPGMLPGELGNLAQSVEAMVKMPSVTTRNGQKAIIEAVREFIYAVEFDKEKSPDGKETERMVPKGFEMTPVGFRLEVEPVIGTDGNTIDLVLAPQTPSFTGWNELEAGAGFKVRQPVFLQSRVSTSVTIWDGQTVMFGGEMPVSPFLMDPSLSGDAALKAETHPVLVFVTPRLIDPSGRPAGKQAQSAARTEGPQVEPVAFHLGPKWFREKDLIELVEVSASSAKMEKGDTVTVKGRCRAGSLRDAMLVLRVIDDAGKEAQGAGAVLKLAPGEGEQAFELTCAIREVGYLRVALHPGGERTTPVGGVYFGTAQQMKAAAALKTPK